MNGAAAASNSPAPALAAVLHAANMRVALIAMLLVGASIFVVGLVVLRVYMVDNLNLSARAVAYAVEAAVVFDDREAAGEALSLMIENRPIAAAYVIDRDGDEIARWRQPAGGAWLGLEQTLAGIVLAQPALEPILHDGQPVGAVKLYGSGRDLLIFLMISTACGLSCLVLCGVVASRLSRRASQRIVAPLLRLAAVAAKARRERQFLHRVEPAAIAELRDLGDDFNALMEELERWREQMHSHSESLAYQANHDSLTGLANRAQFEARLQEMLAVARDNAGLAALFFVDVDRFKSINDTLGHEAGDAVLCAIAGRLRSNVRESDLVARLGGDEFAVLLAPLGDVEQAGRIAGNMLESMAEPIALPSGETLTNSLSIGIAFYPAHAVDAAALLNVADEAMYRAKQAGRGTYAVAGEKVLAMASGGTQ